MLALATSPQTLRRQVCTCLHWGQHSFPQVSEFHWSLLHELLRSRTSSRICHQDGRSILMRVKALGISGGTRWGFKESMGDSTCARGEWMIWMGLMKGKETSKPWRTQEHWSVADFDVLSYCLAQHDSRHCIWNVWGTTGTIILDVPNGSDQRKVRQMSTPTVAHAWRPPPLRWWRSTFNLENILRWESFWTAFAWHTSSTHRNTLNIKCSLNIVGHNLHMQSERLRKTWL